MRPNSAVAGLRSSQLPRSSRASQPYTAGTDGHFARARITVWSILRSTHLLTHYSFRRRKKIIDRRRSRNPEPLRILDAEPDQSRQNFGLFHELRNHADPDRLRDSYDRAQFVQGGVGAEEATSNGSVHFDKVDAQGLEGCEGRRAPPESVDRHPASKGAHGRAEPHRRVQPAKNIDLVDLEAQCLRGHTELTQCLRDVPGKTEVLERRTRNIYAELPESLERAAGYSLHQPAYDPAVKGGHHAVLLEYREEFARRKQFRLFFAQSHQHFRHDKSSFLQLGDRLQVKLKFIAGKRLAQSLRRIAPPGELTIHRREEFRVDRYGTILLVHIEKRDTSVTSAFSLARRFRGIGVPSPVLPTCISASNTVRSPDRVIDTGIRAARANVAFDQALIEARNAGKIPDTIRFLRFRPSALVGLHQILAHEVRLDYCRQTGIEVGRRITGGGGLYLDEGQIGWELVMDRRRLGTTDLAEIAARICRAAASGLRQLGIQAEFRPRNDIEVGGRKISGTGGFIDGNTLFYQGTLLIEFDPARMIDVLKVPVEKLAKRDLDDARRRVVTVREVLGRTPSLDEVYAALLTGFREELGFRPRWDSATEYEENLATALYEREFGTEDFVHLVDAPEAEEGLVSATLVRRGGTLRADIRLEGPGLSRIREVLLTGDFFVTPPRTIFDLEARLRGRATAEVGSVIDGFFASTECDLVALAPADFREVVDRALRQLTFRADGHVLRGHWRGPAPGTLPSLVFLHDALGSTRMWSDVPDQIVRATGCGALIFDRWGSGDSEPLALPHHRDYLLREALRVLPEVLAQAKLKDVILVGQSDGASIALAFAGAYPELVRGVVAISPHLFREPRTLDAIRAQISDFRQGDLKARLQRHHGRKAEVLFERLVEVWTADDAAAGWGLEPYVAGIRCPVLAIQGENDEFFSERQLEALRACAPGSVEVRKIAECGHYPFIQARGATLAAVTQFIRALLDAREPRLPERVN